MPMTQLTEQEVRAFVGPKSDRYLKKWEKALQGDGNAEGFNWSAFGLSGLWLPYRKMYLHTVILYGIIVVESIVEEVVYVGVLHRPEPPFDLGRIVTMAVAFTCGLCGNQWYLSRARKVIDEVRSQGLSEEEHLREVSRRGGANLLACVGFFLLFLGVLTAVLVPLDLLFARR